MRQSFADVLRTAEERDRERAALRAAVVRAEFYLMRARTSADYAARFLREHPGCPEAREGMENAAALRERAEQSLREAERALEEASRV